MDAEKIKKLLILQDASLKEAMQALNVSSSKILFVVNGGENLAGSLTDGDIRRSILNGSGFDRPISEIMQEEPYYVKRADKEHRKKAEKGIASGLHAVPVLDEAHKIVDILFWREFLEKHPSEPGAESRFENPVIIMAGGKGSRLDPFTKILPKPLIPFGDKPIVEKIMDNFNKNGFSNFTLILNYKKDLIKAYFMENRLPYNVGLAEEEKCLGTAGGLGLLKGKVKDTFFVCNCDILFEDNFKNILHWHKEEKSLITLIGCHKEMVFPYGVLQIDAGRLKSITEKPKFDMIINTGVYVMEPEALEFISPNEHIDMNNLIERVMRRGKVTVYPVCEGWFDLGQWKEYQESLYLLRDHRKGLQEND